MLCAAGSALSEQQRRQSSAPAALEEYRIHTQPRRKSCNGLSLYGFCEAATAYTVRGTSPCDSAQGSERVSTRVVAELSTAADSVHLSSWRAASALLKPALLPEKRPSKVCYARRGQWRARRSAPEVHAGAAEFLQSDSERFALPGRSSTAIQVWWRAVAGVCRPRTHPLPRAAFESQPVWPTGLRNSVRTL